MNPYYNLPQSTHILAGANSKEQQRGGNSKRRAPRAEASNSKRSIRILSTDKSNFRNMVQMLTGIPSAAPQSTSDVGIITNYNTPQQQQQQQIHMAPYVHEYPPPDVPCSMPTIDTSSVYLLSNTQRHASSSSSSVVANSHQPQWPPLRQTDLKTFSSASAALTNDLSNFAVSKAADGVRRIPCTTSSHNNSGYGSASDRSSSTSTYNISNHSPPFFDWRHHRTSALAGTAGDADPTELLSSSSNSNLSLDEDDSRRRRLQIHRQAAELENLLMADDLCSPTWSLTPSYSNGWRFPDLVVHTPTPKTIASLLH